MLLYTAAFLVILTYVQANLSLEDSDSESLETEEVNPPRVFRSDLFARLKPQSLNFHNVRNLNVRFGKPRANGAEVEANVEYNAVRCGCGQNQNVERCGCGQNQNVERCGCGQNQNVERCGCGQNQNVERCGCGQNQNVERCGCGQNQNVERCGCGQNQNVERCGCGQNQNVERCGCGQNQNIERCGCGQNQNVERCGCGQNQNVERCGCGQNQNVERCGCGQNQNVERCDCSDQNVEKPNNVVDFFNKLLQVLETASYSNKNDDYVQFKSKTALKKPLIENTIKTLLNKVSIYLSSEDQNADLPHLEGNILDSVKKNIEAQNTEDKNQYVEKLAKNAINILENQSASNQDGKLQYPEETLTAFKFQRKSGPKKKGSVFPLTKQQIKRIQESLAKKFNGRRSAVNTGVPFELLIDGLGQLNA